MKKAKIINPLLILFFCFLPVFVFAATLENKYPQLPGFSAGNNTSLLVYVFNLCVYAAGLIAVLAIIYQGVSILLSKGVVAKVEEAKDRIKAALLGLAILFGSYLLLGVINPELTKINLDLAGFNFPSDVFKINQTDNTVTYKEVPLGSIIEAILIPNSTSVDQVFNYSQLSKKTEENCYLYDQYGNTIDRNGDGAIDGHDVVEGLDMAVCMDNLLNAIVAKIKWFNGNETICNGNTANTAGPINSMKAFIQDGTEGCNQNNCALWPNVSYPNDVDGWLGGCKTVDPYTRICQDADTGSNFEVIGTACRSACTCCGGPRGSTAGTSASCQETPLPGPFYLANTYISNDPCKNRQKIDCARQEMNFRIYGHGLDLGLKCAGVYEYSPDIAPFIDEENNTLKIIDYTDDYGNTYKAQFLTFTNKDNPQGAKERMTSFKNYFENRLIELKAARDFINLDKTKNVLSLAEFQSLQESSSVKVDKEPLIPDYDPSTYHSFTCKTLDNNGICIEGELVDLKSEGYAFLPGEKYEDVGTLGEGQKPTTDPPTVDSSAYTSDEFAFGWPFAAKRIWNNKLAEDTTLKSDVYNSGDPDTLYILSDAGTTDATKYSEAAKTGLISLSPTTAQCTLKDSEKTAAKQIDRGTLTSNIPIGQLADGMAKYINELYGIIDSTVTEIDHTIYSADQLANVLPEQCNCSNAKNKGTCEGGDPNIPTEKACPPAMEWTLNFSPQTCADYPPCSAAPAQKCSAINSATNSTCSACVAKEQEICDLGCLDYCAMNKKEDSAYLYCFREKSEFAGLGGVPDRYDDIFYSSSAECRLSGSKNDLASIMKKVQSKTPFTIIGEHCVCPSRDEFYYIDFGASIKKTFVPWESCSVKGTGLGKTCGGEFKYDSECYTKAQKAYGKDFWSCVKEAPELSLGPFWSKVSCKGNKITIEPKKTLVCKEGEDTEITEDDKSILKNETTNRPWRWSSRDSKMLVISDLDCCDMYYFDGGQNKVVSDISRLKTKLTVPPGFEATCVVTDYKSGSAGIKFKKVTSQLTTKPTPTKDTKVYYVCPYNDIKKEQSKIYKQVASPSLANLASWGTNQACLDNVPGFLQRIEVWQKRLRDYQNGVNLLPGDENRFTLLDRLNITRTRFNECVQGFKIENKDAAARTYLFTCEEGMNSEKLGVNKILPQFPPYNSNLPETKSNKDQWGCYPFNSNGLTDDQKRNCQINPGWTECQLAINQHTPDFYCCLSGQSSTH